MLCTNVLDCSDDVPSGEKKLNDMNAKELRIAQRIVLELYCQYEQSLPFREVVSSEVICDKNFSYGWYYFNESDLTTIFFIDVFLIYQITEYHRIIKKPIALDVIRDKLKSDHANHYTDLRLVMADIRLMFKNAFTYNPVSRSAPDSPK